jgi:hypothetical protein
LGIFTSSVGRNNIDSLFIYQVFEWFNNLGLIAGKLPFGIYFEMEKSGLNLNEIDTTDCDMSLVSLQVRLKI